MPHGHNTPTLEPWGCSPQQPPLSALCVGDSRAPAQPAHPAAGAGGACLGHPAGSILQPCRGAQGFAPGAQSPAGLTRAPRAALRLPNLCGQPGHVQLRSHGLSTRRGSLQPAPAAAVWGLRGSAPPGQQLQIPRGPQTFPTRALVPPECTPRWLQARLLPEHCEGGPAQCGFAGHFPKPRDVLGTTGAAGESQASGVPGRARGVLPSKA